MQSEAQGDQAMQLLHSDTRAEEESLRPAEQEIVDIDAFIEAQLRTGVLLEALDFTPRDEVSL